MTSMYRSIFPLSQRDTYEADANVDFVMSLDGEKLIPGSVVLEGEVAVYANKAGLVGLDGEDITYDPLVGWHCLTRDWTTEFGSLGVLEPLANYPRLVKMNSVATQHEESLASESAVACEGRAPTAGVARGYLYGRTETDKYVPFSFAPQIAVNKASGPLSSAATGQIRLRVRLAPDNEVLSGAGVTSAAGYIIKNLKLRFQTVPDDGKLAPVNIQVYTVFRTNIDSNNQNVSTFVPAACSAVQMSFIAQADEGTLTKNYLQLAPLPGIPPLGATGTAASGAYGIERLYYSINDTESGAVVDFTFESREEVMRNGLRAFNSKVDKFNALLRHLNDPASADRYIAGIPFGGLINFKANKFACEIQSQASNTVPYVGYFYFLGLVTINA